VSIDRPEAPVTAASAAVALPAYQMIVTEAEGVSAQVFRCLVKVGLASRSLDSLCFLLRLWE